MDMDTGSAIELNGAVMRATNTGAGASAGGLGVQLFDPPDSWVSLVSRQRTTSPTAPAVGSMRLRIVVAGDEARRRGALALYVTSGWDVRFAADQATVTEALRAGAVDAVIAEHDLGDDRWRHVLLAARDIQPHARRIIRSPLYGSQAPSSARADDLVHRVVDADAGLAALLDALTADYGFDPPQPGAFRTPLRQHDSIGRP